MRSEESDRATATSEETAPKAGAVEQTKTSEPSFQDQLIALAQEQGQIEKAAEPPKPVGEPKTPEEPSESPPDTESAPSEPPAEGEDSGEEEQLASKKGEPWPQSASVRVAEETDKRKRANDRADRAEAELAKERALRVEAEQKLVSGGAPVPTVDNPLIDIQDPRVLDRLERVYELLGETDIEKIDDDGMVNVPAAIGQDGKIIYQKIDPEQARLAQKRADRVLRKDIPKRREYLAQRALMDSGTNEWYPDLQNPDHQFTQLVNQLTSQVQNGTAMSNPEVRFWAANAVYGYMMRRKESDTRNGEGSGVKKIVEASRQRLAPTAPRTRSSSVERRSADLAKSQEKFEKNPSDRDAAAEYVSAVLSRGRSQKTVQPVAE